MDDGADPKVDIGVALFLVVVCSAVLIESRKIPPGSFEPLGSAPVPQATAGLIILLALVVMGRAVLVLRRGRTSVAEDPGFQPRPLDAALTFALTVVYVLVMAFRLLPFAWITSLFLFVAIGFLVRFERRLLPAAAVVGALMGFGCEYLFTRVFVVDLPAS